METASAMELLRISLDRNLSMDVHVGGTTVGLALLFLLFTLLVRFRTFRRLREFEIDEAELGIANQKILLRANTADLQIAYKIWVELSTRKIGLPIDLDHDVLLEVYDSWYEFFSVTRNHIKDVPATRFRRKETEQIIRLSIDILNLEVRPHLTRWQARFRRWYEQQLAKEENQTADPQSIQAMFPQYDELVADLCIVNQRLVLYRQTLYDLLAGHRHGCDH
jgi:hypothetical protein